MRGLGGIIALNDELRVRFTVADDSPAAVVEAGLDDVVLRSVICLDDLCPWDLSGDGIVATADILLLFASWGLGGPADFDGDGVTATADLLAMLGAWGECPLE